MATHVTKPRMVDARQFDGSKHSGYSLVHWINSHGEEAIFREGDDEQATKIWLGGRNGVPVYANNWIVRHESGKFTRMFPQEFNEEYEKI